MAKMGGTTKPTTKARALPRFRPAPFLCGPAAALLLAGCTTAALELEPGTTHAGDATLPQTVAAVPTMATAVAEPVAVAASAIGDGAADLVQTAFAGSMPDRPRVSMPAPDPVSAGRSVAPRSPELDALIARYAVHHDIPESLLRRVVKRESTFNPTARNGPYWGLMQILPQTARTMGYKGSAEGLLDAETNLIYAGKYLRGAWLVADGNHDLAVRYYSRGYYYDAKRRGMLEVTGLGKDRRRMR